MVSQSFAICDRTLGTDQEAPPQHGMNAPKPDVDQIGGGLHSRVHDHGSLASYGFNRDRRALPEEPAMGLVCPRFEMDSRESFPERVPWWQNKSAG